MSWASYKPLSNDARVNLEHLSLIPGDALTLVKNGQAQTKYLVVECLNGGDSANLWNYQKRKFELRNRDTIVEWRESGAVLKPILLNQALTVHKDDTTDRVVGLRLHGSGTQSPNMVEQFGKGKFGFSLSLAIENDVYGSEITEPYSVDYSTVHPSFEDFIEACYNEFIPPIVEQTALSEKAAEKLLNDKLAVMELNAYIRFGDGLNTGWKFADSKEDAIQKIKSLDDSFDWAVSWDEETDSQVLFHSD